ncbi:Solute carrier family 12 member 9 [Armadillidium vulgare]|nr:Solute carrier family 12 member 9 [Armadillidium vulgare]
MKNLCNLQKEVIKRTRFEPLVLSEVSLRLLLYASLVLSYFSELESALLINKKKKAYNSFTRHVHTDEESPQSLKRSNKKDKVRTLGTFGGVFTPVALCQFSTLLFLRIGFVIGDIGLYAGFSTLVLAYAILLTTVLSISAISTNGAIEGGGLYFMISRILGPEFGGSIGLLFAFSNMISSGLYNIGCIDGVLESFGEDAGKLSIMKVLPSSHWHKVGYRTLLNVFNLIICLTGSGMFKKTIVFLFVLVFGSTISIITSFVAIQGNIEIPFPEENEANSNLTGTYTGLSLDTLQDNLYPNLTLDYTSGRNISFATIFSVIFSGVKGIMNGANMSGELINPGFSIPAGTLGALLFTFSTYTILFILTASTCSRFLLQNNYNFLIGINVWPPLVTIGVITATMSSSLSKMIGASRVLAAIVKDNIFGNVLSWLGLASYGSNPIGCILMAFLVTQCIIMVGELNTIAVIATVFSLMSYTSLSIACFCLEWASAPNFRPTFQYFSWWTALLGIIGNFCMMMIVSPSYSIMCVMICLLLIIGLYICTPVSPNSWGSISQAILYYQVRKFLLMLDPRKDHVKFWRPQILLLVSDPLYCCPLLDFVNDLKKSGLYILGHVVVEDYDETQTDPSSTIQPKWQFLVDHLKIKAFIEVTTETSVRKGVQHLARLAGLGALKPNIIILGFCDDASNQNFLLRRTQTEKHFIDVWPMNFFDFSENNIESKSSLFSLQMATVVNMVPAWHKKTQLRVFLCVWSTAPEDLEREKTMIYDTLKGLRINATIAVLSLENTNLPKRWSSEETFQHAAGTTNHFPQRASFRPSQQFPESYFKSVNLLIQANSYHSSLCFMNLPSPPADPAYHTYYIQALTSITHGLPPTVLVHGLSAVTDSCL